jgi:hypothetical protein
VIVDGSTTRLAADGSEGKGSLTSTSSGPRGRLAFPTSAPGPALAILGELSAGPRSLSQYDKPTERRAILQLRILNAVNVDDDAVTACPGLVDGAGVVQGRLLQLLSEVRGGERALALLAADAGADQILVGQVLREENNADWADSTAASVGKYFRAWAKSAGVPIHRAKARA